MRPNAGAANIARPPTTTAIALVDVPTFASPPVRLASEITPAPSSVTPATIWIERRSQVFGEAALGMAPCIHAAAVPTAAAAAGIMIPSPGHRPMARAATRIAAVAAAIARWRRWFVDPRSRRRG